MKKNRRMGKRLAALLLAMAVVSSSIPVSAQMTDDDKGSDTDRKEEYSADGVAEQLTFDADRDTQSLDAAQAAGSTSGDRYFRDDVSGKIYRLGYTYDDYSPTRSGVFVKGEGDSIMIYDPAADMEYDREGFAKANKLPAGSGIVILNDYVIISDTGNEVVILWPEQKQIKKRAYDFTREKGHGFTELSEEESKSYKNTTDTQAYGGKRYFRVIKTGEVIELGPEYDGFVPTYSGLFIKGEGKDVTLYSPILRKLFSLEDITSEYRNEITVSEIQNIRVNEKDYLCLKSKIKSLYFLYPTSGAKDSNFRAYYTVTSRLYFDDAFVKGDKEYGFAELTGDELDTYLAEGSLEKKKEALEKKRQILLEQNEAKKNNSVSENTALTDDETVGGDTNPGRQTFYIDPGEAMQTVAVDSFYKPIAGGYFVDLDLELMLDANNGILSDLDLMVTAAKNPAAKAAGAANWAVENDILVMNLKDGSKLAYDPDLRILTDVASYKAKAEQEGLTVFEPIFTEDVHKYESREFIDTDNTEILEDLDTGKTYTVPVGGIMLSGGFLYYKDTPRKCGLIININTGERFKFYTSNYSGLCLDGQVEDGAIRDGNLYFDPITKKWGTGKPVKAGRYESVRMIGDQVLRHGYVAWMDDKTQEVVIVKEGWTPLHGGGLFKDGVYKIGESGEEKKIPNGFTRQYHSNLLNPVTGQIMDLSTGKETNRTVADNQGTYVLFDMSEPEQGASNQRKEGDDGGEGDVSASVPFVEAEANTYILEATTGAEAGDNIAFFIVSYESDGQDRSIYVFPKSGDFAEGMKEMNAASEKNGVDIIKKNQEYMSYTDLVNATPVGGKANETITPLASESKNQVMFHTKEKIDKVKNIEFFTHYVKGGHNGWTCQGLSVYEVGKIYGLDMVGGFSKEYFANFSGKLLADLKFSGSKDGGFKTYTWANDLVENLGGTTVVDEKGNKTFRENPYSKIMTEGFDGGSDYDPQSNDRYGFRIDFADKSDAGLECLSYRGKTSLKNGGYVESLELKMVYTDVAGKTRVLTLPVITNALKWAADHGVGDKEVAGVYQVGQSLYFDGMIPGFSKVNSISLLTGNDKVIADCGMKKNTNATSQQQDRRNQSNGESAAITCFAMYHIKDGVSVKASLDGSFIHYDYQGLPIFYRMAETEYGMDLEANTEFTLQLTTPESENDMVPPGWNTKKYLVGVTTDSSRASGTLADVKMQFAYTDTAGAANYTEWFSLRDQARSFYGYWYSDTTKNGDFGYVNGMSPGNKMYFIISVANVDQFTNARYQLESGTDDWQTNGLEIWALDSLTGLESDWTQINSRNGDTVLQSDARFYREFNGINILNIEGKTVSESADDEDGVQGSDYSYLPDSLLVQSNEPVEWIFKSKDLEETEDESFANIGYDMTYEDCLQNFGFDKPRRTYKIKVKVSDQAIDISGNGDCGSKNNFYFQLLFENGSSAVVLANTQLEGDIFRTGNTETITISTNKDYGNVTGVRIIPEEVQEDAEADDKLKIDEIRVVEDSLDSFSETWIVEGTSIPNEGWIGKKSYLDDGQKNTAIEENMGRYLAEIATDLPITVHTNELNLLCCLTTDEYAEDTSQFYGEMKLTVDYIQTDGTPNTETFDIVEAMYKYYNKPVEHDQDTVDQGRTAARDPAVSNRYMMFRGGHTDRFNITLRNVKSLYQATLTGQSRGDTSELSIAALSFNTIEEAGRLQISNKDEYVRTGKTTLITSNSVVTNENAKLANTFAKGDEQKIKIGLLPNEVEVKDQGSKWLAVFSREPVSQNDTLNIYVYPTEDSIPVSQFGLTCKAEYTNVSGTPYVTGQVPMQKHESTGEDDKPYFYVNGITAKGIASLDALYAVGDNSFGDQNAYIDYAVIQQVRSGTVINTWHRAGNRGLVSSGVRMNLQGEQTAGLYDRQKVLVQLSPDMLTEETKLLAEKDDIAISLRYTTTMDPTGKEVFSAYKYITDQNYTRIQPGQIIEMTFDEPYIKEITGVRIIKFGDTLKACADGVAVANYHRTNSADTDLGLAGWYSFGEKTVLMGTPTTIEKTGSELASENVIQPLRIAFTTAGAKGFTESGTDTPVRMTVGYEDAYKKVREVTFSDITKFITDRDVHSFQTGQTQEICLLTAGMQKVRYVILEPYNSLAEDGSVTTGDLVAAGWTIDQITAQLGDYGNPVSRTVEDRIYEGQPKKINLTNMSMTVSAYFYSEIINSNDIRTVTDRDADFTIASDVSVFFRPELYGSDEGMNVTVLRKVGDTKETVSGMLSSAENEKTKKTEYTFTPERNYTGDNVVYYVTFESKENEAVHVTFTVTVQPEEVTVSGNSTTTTGGNEDI
ncbi:MAG: hypothetical protein K6E84_09320 [Lachnospiraceae bacterium]|nr:hypothetical protein [Lachnospiraceae bacterium]